MIALNVDSHCLIYRTGRVDVQPALSGVEISILRFAADCPALSISALAADLGLSYPNAYAMCYRLRSRGLVQLKRNGNGLEVTSLAELVEQ